MFTDPQRLLRRNATGRTLLGCPSRVDRHEVRPLTLALVFEQREERSPRGRRRIAAVRRVFHHPLDVQVFDRHEVVLPSVVVRELVQEVAALPSKVGVTLRDPPPLLLVVVRPVLLPREFSLLSFQAVTLVGEVWRPDRRAVGIVGVVEYPYVDADAFLGVLRRFRWYTVHFDAEGGEPFTCGVLLERDLLECRVVGDGAVEPNRYVREFRE